MNFTPKQIVDELSRYIIGQDDAKKAVAIALRNRYRRSKLSEQEREEITPKNIILKGPTGVGKTEIARRLAKLVKAPFIKVEATKYTEVGYVGRDVESMVRDLVEASIRLVKEEKYKDVEGKTAEIADKKIATAIAKSRSKNNPDVNFDDFCNDILVDLKEGKYNDLLIDIEVNDVPKSMDLPVGAGGSEINLGDMFGNMFPQKKKRRKMTVKQARTAVMLEESEKIIDSDLVNAEAIRRAENDGIIFIDEIDKICGKSSGSGPNVSREGVQRDILPIVEGSTITTKYGPVKTNYILFIAAGAFHMASFSDLIPELQGRFPVVVQLQSLTQKDFYNILSQPENSLTFQYEKLLSVDNVKLSFTDDALSEIAEIAYETNSNMEDLGARRLHTIMESLLTDILYEYVDMESFTKVVIDKEYVNNHLTTNYKNQDLKKYIL